MQAVRNPTLFSSARSYYALNSFEIVRLESEPRFAYFIRRAARDMPVPNTTEQYYNEQRPQRSIAHRPNDHGSGDVLEEPLSDVRLPLDETSASFRQICNRCLQVAVMVYAAGFLYRPLTFTIGIPIAVVAFFGAVGIWLGSFIKSHRNGPAFR
jgi:hypothetical protein